jgi:hypothetical protein
VINHWGGIPAALHRNAVIDMKNKINGIELHEVYPVNITRFDPECSFKEIVFSDKSDEVCLVPTRQTTPKSLFKSFEEQGYDVVVLGACGIDEGRCLHVNGTRYNSQLPDPTKSMISDGVSYCSLYDGAYFKGDASTHDTHALSELKGVLLDDGGSRPRLIWVNLLSCRDIPLVRFQKVMGFPSSDSISIRQTPVSLDPRVKPPLPTFSGDSIYEIRSSLNEYDAHIHGEADKHTIKEDEYACLLDQSWSVIQRLNTEISDTLSELSLEGTDVVICASHSISLGESGTRLPGPFRVNTTSFWLSTFEMKHESISLSAMFRRVAHMKNVTSQPAAEKDVPCIGEVRTKEGAILMARVPMTLNDQRYACIINWPGNLPCTSGLTHLTNYELRAVYDVSSDLFECDNLLPKIQHLVEDIHVKLKRCLPVHARLRYPSVKLSSPPVIVTDGHHANMETSSTTTPSSPNRFLQNNNDSPPVVPLSSLRTNSLITTAEIFPQSPRIVPVETTPSVASTTTRSNAERNTSVRRSVRSVEARRNVMKR